MALTVEQVIEAYQNSVPGMRTRFARKIEALRQTLGSEHDYMRRHPIKVLQLAEDELRTRDEAASAKIEALLDSGWIPTPSESIKQVFSRCFIVTDWTKDPFSDLEDAVIQAYADVARNQHLADQEAAVFQLGHTRSQIAIECQSHLEMYVVKHPLSPPITVNNNAPVMSQQFGNHNTVNMAHTVSMDRIKIESTIKLVHDNILAFPESEREEVDEHLSVLKEQLESSDPKPSRVRSAAKAIARIASPLGLAAVNAALEGIASGVTQSLMGL